MNSQDAHPFIPLERRPGLTNRWSRRNFLTAAGAAAVLLQLPTARWVEALVPGGNTPDSELTRHTMNGLVAFAVPGPDPYSIAQGRTSPTPGGVAAAGGDAMIATLDAFVGVPTFGMGDSPGSAPLSSAVAAMLDATAAQVDPAAAGGPFPSHFARLAFEGKAEVFERLQATPGDDDAARTARYFALVVPMFAVFCSLGEWQVFDPDTRTVSRRPVGWDITDYYPGHQAPAAGWDDFRGYYKGRKRAHG